LKDNCKILQLYQTDKKWFCAELSTIGYREAWDLQCDLAIARKNRIIDNDIVLFLEHPPVFTLGRRGGYQDLLVSKEFLEKSGIQIIQVERGGNITYHGPGQLVVYPIINLRKARLSVIDYVECLEEIMIRAAAEWGIKAERNSINRGVWVGNNKIGSIGIAIRRGIAFHGFAFNVNNSLEPFTWIQPCGLKNVKMTSLAQELSCKIFIDQVRKAVEYHLENVFGINLVTTELSELQDFLKNPA
jgi:lipoate-protein ligase B